MSISSRLLPSAVAGALLVALAGCGSGARPDPTLAQDPRSERPVAAGGSFNLPQGASQNWQPLTGRGFKSTGLDGIGIGRAGNDRSTATAFFEDEIKFDMENGGAPSGDSLDFYLAWALDTAGQGGASLVNTPDTNTPDAAPVFVAPGTPELRTAGVIGAEDENGVQNVAEAEWLASENRALNVATVPSNPLVVSGARKHNDINWLRSIETTGTGSFGWKADGYRFWRDPNTKTLTRQLLADNGLRFFNSQGTGAGQDGSSADKIRTERGRRLYVERDVDDKDKVVVYDTAGNKHYVADSTTDDISAASRARLPDGVDLVVNSKGNVQVVLTSSAIGTPDNSWEAVSGREWVPTATVDKGRLKIGDDIQLNLHLDTNFEPMKSDADPDSANAGTYHLGANGGLRLDGVEIVPASRGSDFTIDDDNEIEDASGVVVLSSRFVISSTRSDTDPDANNYGTYHHGASTNNLLRDGVEIAPASRGPYALNARGEIVDANGAIVVGLTLNSEVQVVKDAAVGDRLFETALARSTDPTAVYHDAVPGDAAASVAASWFINEHGFVVYDYGEEIRLVAPDTTVEQAARGQGFVFEGSRSTERNVYDVFPDAQSNNGWVERVRADVEGYNADPRTTENLPDGTVLYVVNGLLSDAAGNPIDKDGDRLVDPDDPDLELTTTPTAGNPIHMGEFKLQAPPRVGTPIRAEAIVGASVPASYIPASPLEATTGQIIVDTDLSGDERTAAGIKKSTNDSTLIHYDVEVLHPVSDAAGWTLRYSSLALVRASRKDSAGETLPSDSSDTAPEYFLNVFTFVGEDKRTPEGRFKDDGASNDVVVDYDTRLAAWGRSAAAPQVAGASGGRVDRIYLLTGDGELKAQFGRNGGGTVSGAFDTSIYETTSEAGRPFRAGRDWRKITLDDVHIDKSGRNLIFHGGLKVEDAIPDAGDGAGADKGETAAYTGDLGGVFAGPNAEELVGDFTLETPTSSAPDFLGGIVGESWVDPEN